MRQGSALTPVTKYSVSPKHLDGRPGCCSYVIETREPMSRLSTTATLSSRTLKRNFSCAAPAMLTWASAPSNDLQGQPFCEAFGRNPARWPLEEDQAGSRALL